MPHAVSDRLRDRRRLLVDLLEHERLVAALLRALVVPVELDGVVLDRFAGSVEEPRAVGRDRDDLAVPRELDGARLAQERRRVRAEEHLVLADADDERDLVPGPHEQPRVVSVDDDEGEVPLELGECLPDGLHEVAVVVALDQVRHGLRVGLGGERVALGGKALLQLAVVLDDPVEDDRDPRGIASGERMRVLLSDRAVGRPARVTEARRRDGVVRPAARFRFSRFPTART